MKGYSMPYWLDQLLGYLIDKRAYRVASWVAALTLKAGVWGRL